MTHESPQNELCISSTGHRYIRCRQNPENYYPQPADVVPAQQVNIIFCSQNIVNHYNNYGAVDLDQVNILPNEFEKDGLAISNTTCLPTNQRVRLSCSHCGGSIILPSTSRECRLCERKAETSQDWASSFQFGERGVFQSNAEAGRVYQNHPDFESKLNKGNLTPFLNGVLDLDTLEFCDGKPEHCMSLSTGVSYMHNAPGLCVIGIFKRILFKRLNKTIHYIQITLSWRILSDGL